MKDYVSYADIMESFGHEILIQVDDADYQGDTRVLFYDRPNNKYGILIFGWGSCSGCDALEGCETNEEVEELKKGLKDEIEWHNGKRELRKRLESKDWELEYYWHAKESKDFLNQVAKLVKSKKTF